MGYWCQSLLLSLIHLLTVVWGKQVISVLVTDYYTETVPPLQTRSAFAPALFSGKILNLEP